MVAMYHDQQLHKYTSLAPKVVLADMKLESALKSKQEYNRLVWLTETYARKLQLRTNWQGKDLKSIKNVKRCRDGMPKSMQTR